MNILYLKYAVEIAKAGSINKAAEALYVAQPNLSRAIKELEKDLGVVIFERNAKGMTLTKDGELLIQYGKRILKEIDEVENVFKAGDALRQRFSLSSPRASYIGEAFSQFTTDISGIENTEMLYKETDSFETIKNVCEGGYNLGIVRYAESFDRFYKQTFEEKNLCYELVNEFRYSVLASEKSEISKKNSLKLADLDNLVEITHVDLYVPSLPFAAVKKQEISDNIKKKIYVFERASQFEILSKNPSAFMWVSSVPEETLKRYGLVEKTCQENNKKYKDILIYRKDYHLTDFDKAFITRLCEVRRKTFVK